MIRNFVLIALVASSRILPTGAASAVSTAPATLCNPIAGPQAPDPFVVWDDSTQYYYHLHTEHFRLEIYRAKRIADILTAEHKTLYVTNAANRVYGDIWAPEMQRAPNGKWYIYTSGRYLPKQGEQKRLFVMESNTADPFDGFVFKGMPSPDTFSIDPTVTTWTDGKQYICYSEVKAGRGQVLVVREMANPWTFGERQAEIAHAELPWECVDKLINEGAFFVRSPDGKRFFIVYSGNGCWHDDYALGVLEFIGGEGGDLCDAANWRKHPSPLLVKGNGVFGPGHASFFSSPDGKELWCAYHGLAKSNPSNTPTRRLLNLQKVGFDKSGFPVMGEAIGAAAQRAPSGEGGAARLRFMSFNIWGDYFGNPAAERRANVAKSLATHRADVVSLQEVTAGWWRSGLFADLAKEGYAAVTGDMKDTYRRAGGNPKKPGGNFEPLLYRKDRLAPLESGCEIFDLKRTNTKMVTWAVFEDKATKRRFIAFATHFWWKHDVPEHDAIRVAEAQRVVALVKDLRRKWGDIPAIGGGDLNCTVKSAAVKTFLDAGFCDSDCAATVRIRHRSHHGNPVRGEDGAWHSRLRMGKSDNPDLSIDRVLFTDGITASRHEVSVEQYELDASDHAPVIVDFTVATTTTTLRTTGRANARMDTSALVPAFTSVQSFFTFPLDAIHT